MCTEDNTIMNIMFLLIDRLNPIPLSFKDRIEPKQKGPVKVYAES